MQKKYMETLLAQIREKRARECVRQEVEGHINDQKASYIADGIPEDQAEAQAVADMGDPVETGSTLDQLHRPKPAWGMLAMIAVLCAAGALLQYAVYKDHPSSSMGRYFYENQCLYAIFGFLILCGVYLIDYTRIAQYSRLFCIVILLLLFLSGCHLTPFLNLHHSRSFVYINIFRHCFAADILFYLYLPLYGAVLYSYRNCGIRELYKPFLYTVLPIYNAFRFGQHLTVRINITIILFLMLGTAAAKGWFPFFILDEKINSRSAAKNRLLSDIRHHIKAVCLALSGPVIFCTLLFLHLQDYQKIRIQAWLDPSAFESEAGYIYLTIRNILSASQFIGKKTGQSVIGCLPDYESDYILTYIIGTFGVLAAAALVILIIMLSAKLLSISFRQKNQLGMIMGLGCSLVFTIQSAEYILVNLALLPASGLYFPLLSFGGSGMLQTCILLGILLSIYRYENISAGSVEVVSLKRMLRKNV